MRTMVDRTCLSAVSLRNEYMALLTFVDNRLGGDLGVVIRQVVAEGI